MCVWHWSQGKEVTPCRSEERKRVALIGYFLALMPILPLPSPFEVQVSPEAGTQKVRAWGPGLETGQVGKSADFVVEAIGTEVGTLGKWLGGRRGGT